MIQICREPTAQTLCFKQMTLINSHGSYKIHRAMLKYKPQNDVFEEASPNEFQL